MIKGLFYFVSLICVSSAFADMKTEAVLFSKYSEPGYENYAILLQKSPGNHQATFLLCKSNKPPVNDSVALGKFILDNCHDVKYGKTNLTFYQTGNGESRYVLIGHHIEPKTVFGIETLNTHISYREIPGAGLSFKQLSITEPKGRETLIRTADYYYPLYGSTVIDWTKMTGTIQTEDK